MSIYTGEKCSWCNKEDMTVLILDPNEVKESFMLCIPCLTEVREDWKREQEGASHLKLIK